MKELQMKNKEQLDVLTKEQIKAYRYDFLKHTNHPDGSIYVKELMLYISVRFEQDQIDMYDRWKKETIEWEKAGKDLNDSEYISKKLCGKIESKVLYDFIIKTDRKQLTPLKFIIV